ncbi:hypothetical protein O3G_MSEX012995 [Manduca sexta]|uniref:Alcohol dehydrogenase-like N-terminal domain-containing protein n=1 Tax=Manduca sexta TaxID=7130 RepID=A0A921ZS94_MANSE|nr:hypothetical protein O3G_MSEX012995 [Manduca sexta]
MSAVVLRAAARCTSSAAGGRMRAWRVHGYEPAEPRLEEARVPALRAPDELLVRVHAASVNPLDVAMLGGYGARVLNTLRAAEGGEGVEFPLVPGRDFVGVVERAGAAARLRRGERVWGVVPPHRQGTHAQYVVVRDSWVIDLAMFCNNYFHIIINMLPLNMSYHATMLIAVSKYL